LPTVNITACGYNSFKFCVAKWTIDSADGHLVQAPEPFQPDPAVDPGRFACGTALSGRGRRGLLAVARHVASPRPSPPG
jgi:hypothetical protein